MEVTSMVCEVLEGTTCPQLLIGRDEGNEVVVGGCVPVAGEGEKEWIENATHQKKELDKLVGSGLAVVGIACTKGKFERSCFGRNRLLLLPHLEYRDKTGHRYPAVVISEPRWVTVRGSFPTMKETVFEHDPSTAVTEIVKRMNARIDLAVLRHTAGCEVSIKIPTHVDGVDDLWGTHAVLSPGTTMSVGNTAVSGTGRSTASAIDALRKDLKRSVSDSLEEWKFTHSDVVTQSDFPLLLPSRVPVHLPPSNHLSALSWFGYGASADIKFSYSELVGLSRDLVKVPSDERSKFKAGSTEFELPSWIFVGLFVLLTLLPILMFAIGT